MRDKKEQEMTPVEKTKLTGKISEILLKKTDDLRELLQILDGVISFHVN
jgi:hypothetical protein